MKNYWCWISFKWVLGQQWHHTRHKNWINLIHNLDDVFSHFLHHSLDTTVMIENHSKTDMCLYLWLVRQTTNKSGYKCASPLQSSLVQYNGVSASFVLFAAKQDCELENFYLSQHHSPPSTPHPKKPSLSHFQSRVKQAALAKSEEGRRNKKQTLKRGMFTCARYSAVKSTERMTRVLLRAVDSTKLPSQCPVNYLTVCVFFFNRPSSQTYNYIQSYLYSLWSETNVSYNWFE